MPAAGEAVLTRVRHPPKAFGTGCLGATHHQMPATTDHRPPVTVREDLPAFAGTGLSRFLREPFRGPLPRGALPRRTARTLAAHSLPKAFGTRYPSFRDRRLETPVPTGSPSYSLRHQPIIGRALPAPTLLGTEQAKSPATARSRRSYRRPQGDMVSTFPNLGGVFGREQSPFPAQQTTSSAPPTPRGDSNTASNQCKERGSWEPSRKRC